MAKEIANGLIDLSYPPKITQCKTVVGEAGWMSEKVRQYIELLVKNDLIPGHLGLEGAVEYYKPPVKKPLVQIDGKDYAWTIEEEPIEATPKEIDERPKSRSNIKKGEGSPKKKILVVEDDPDFAKVLKIRLKDNGYDVVTASDAKEFHRFTNKNLT